MAGCLSRRSDPAPPAAGRLAAAASPLSASAESARAPVSVELSQARTAVIYGDSRSQHDAHRRVVAAIRQVKPDVVFHSGDLVNNGRSSADWRIFDQITGDLRREARFYPTLGNHEFDAREYFDRFALPGNGRWYAVDTPIAHFVVLDSGSRSGPDSEQRRWLESTLRRPRLAPVIVLLHVGMFSTGPHGGDPNLVRDLLPVLERGRVAAVFAGHDHDYERTVHGRMVHVVTGGGGGPLYDQAKRSPDSVKFVKAHHFCELTRQGPKVRVQVLTPELELLDEFEVGD
jgi:3',5'-cyclic AMP phosphodiesterase CpdA